MRTASAQVAAACGVSLMVAAGSIAAPALAGAQPAGHKVRYTLTSQAGGEFNLYYLVNQPADKQAYNKDAYSYLKTEPVTLGPGQPWTFETTLADPQWAILTVSSTTHGGRAAPNAHCEIAIDDQLATQQDAPYNLQCQLSQW